MKRKKDCTSCQYCTKLNGAQNNKDKIWWLCDLRDLRVDYPDRYKCTHWKARPYNRDTFTWIKMIVAAGDLTQRNFTQ